MIRHFHLGCSLITSKFLNTLFPNLNVVLRIFPTISVTAANEERFVLSNIKKQKYFTYDYVSKHTDHHAQEKLKIEIAKNAILDCV